jgi:predicted acyl esterase
MPIPPPFHAADLLPAAITECVLPATADPGFQRRSIYVPVADGTRLAVDIFLPQDLAPNKRLSTLYTATRYWRGMDGHPIDPAQKEWIARGFAVVNVDARGTGASFGQWYIPYATQEARDLGFLATWIARQPWSNGNVVMTGNSYPGTTPLMVAAYGAPAIKAIAPKFSDFDAYTDLLFPGGVSSVALTVKWGQLVHALDSNELPSDSESASPMSVRPVDGPDGKALLAAAIKAHLANPWSFDKAAYEVTFKDVPSSHFGGLPIDAGGVYRLRDGIERSGVPIFGWGSWLDSGIAQGLLNRFMTLTNPQLTIIGPWTHGAREDVNVYTANEALEPDKTAQDRMIACFLAHYAASDTPKPLVKHTLVYFTMGEDRWKSTDVWPVSGIFQRKFYFAANHSLASNKPSASGHDTYRVDFEASAGPANRWATQAGGPHIDYGDRTEPDSRLLTYTSTPLPRQLELTGQPVVTLRVASTATDGNFFVYLEDVAPDGKTTYVTEGELRALHRKLSTQMPPYKTTYPYRTFAAKDAQPLVPGQTATLTFQLQATSVLFKAGHRIRVAVAGADAGTFLRIPAAPQNDVTLTIERGGIVPSLIELPIVP